MKKIALIAASALVLSGCVTQEDMDEKMSKGCAAGVNSLTAPKEILSIKSKNYANENAEGGLHRRVTLGVVEKDGWLEIDKEYSCLFMQEWGFFKSSHKALLVQVRIDGSVYGKKDGLITGSLDDFLKLSGDVDRAMGQ